MLYPTGAKDSARLSVIWSQLHQLSDIFSPSEGGTVSIFRGISRGRSPREIPRKILTVPTSDGENNILSRIGGMSEELYVPRVAPRASPRGKPSGMPLGQHSGHTNLVTISCKGIFLENINCYFKNIFLPDNEDKMSLY